MFTHTETDMSECDVTERITLARLARQYPAHAQNPHWLLLATDSCGEPMITVYCLADSQDDAATPQCHLERCGYCDGTADSDCQHCVNGAITHQRCLVTDWFSACGAVELTQPTAFMRSVAAGCGPIIIENIDEDGTPGWCYPDSLCIRSNPEIVLETSEHYGHYLSWMLDTDVNGVRPVLHCTGDENSPCHSTDAWAHYHAPESVISAGGREAIGCAIDAWFQDPEVVVAGAPSSVEIPLGPSPVEITQIDPDPQNPSIQWRYTP